MSVIDISLERVNGTVLQLFTARTDEPRASIVADILLNEALPQRRLRNMDTVAAGAAAVVIAHERLQHERPNLTQMLQDFSIERAAVEQTVRTIFESIGPDVDTDRARQLRLEVQACTAVYEAHTNDEPHSFRTDCENISRRASSHC